MTLWDRFIQWLAHGTPKPPPVRRRRPSTMVAKKKKSTLTRKEAS